MRIRALLLYSGTSGCAPEKQYHAKIGTKKRLYTYTYTQRKLRIYDDFMHFWPIFGIIHIHIHIHIKILLRFFAGNGVLISCADRTLTVPRPVTKQIKKAEPPHGCGALL